MPPSKAERQSAASVSRRAPVRKPAAAKKKAPKAEFAAGEAEYLAEQLERHQASERAWQRMTAPPDGEDRWSVVEEHLLDKEHRQDHAERRWKYFAK